MRSDRPQGKGKPTALLPYLKLLLCAFIPLFLLVASVTGMSPEAFMMRGVFDIFRDGSLGAAELEPLLKDKMSRDQAMQVLILQGEREAVDLLWREHERSGDAETLEHLCGAMAGVYSPVYRDFLLAKIEKVGRRKEELNGEVNALIVLGLHGEEAARERLKSIAADYSLRLLSETAERSLGWMEGKFYGLAKRQKAIPRDEQVRRVLKRLFGAQLKFRPIVFNDAGDKAFTNFSDRGEGYNALLRHGPRGWYIAGIWFRYIV